MPISSTASSASYHWTSWISAALSSLDERLNGVSSRSGMNISEYTANIKTATKVNANVKYLLFFGFPKSLYGTNAASVSRHSTMFFTNDWK